MNIVVFLSLADHVRRPAGFRRHHVRFDVVLLHREEAPESVSRDSAMSRSEDGNRGA